MCSEGEGGGNKVQSLSFTFVSGGKAGVLFLFASTYIHTGCYYIWYRKIVYM
jgi:hypothetical protein